MGCPPVKGTVFKRCHCTDPVTGRELGKSCPKFTRSDHGGWWYRHDIPPGPDGRRRTTGDGPYRTETAAGQALADSLSGLHLGGPSVEGKEQTFGEYLDWWIASKTSLKPSTRRGYESHIRLYLKPGLGHLRLAELRDDHFDELYKAMRLIGRDLKGQRPSFLLARLLEVRRDKPQHRRPLSAAAIKLVHATAMSALNAGVRRPSVPLRANPAQYAERPRPRRQRALLWTAPRVAAWEHSGRRPSKVMVWTPAQTGAFLDFVADDRLYALWHLISQRGLRRGEAVALGWAEVDLAAGSAYILENDPDTGGDGVEEGDEYDETKSESSDRLVTLDHVTVSVLRIWRRHQAAERAAAGERWVDSGRVFTQPDGRALSPDGVSQRFDRLVARYTTIRREHLDRGWSVDYLAARHRMPTAAIQIALDNRPLPPTRLHDLRHHAASIAYRATRDMKAVSDLLGHSSIQITGDVYTTLFEEARREAAEAAARIVPRTRRPAGWDELDHDPSPDHDGPEPDGPDLGL